MNTKEFKKRHQFISALRNINVRGSIRLANIAGKILIPEPKGELVLKIQRDIKLKINPVEDSGVERSLYYSGTYESGILNLLNLFLEENDVFVDIGANIGLMSIFASKVLNGTGEVASFEAHPQTAKILSENIDLNELTNVTVNKVALGNTNGTSKIYSQLEINRGAASMLKPNDQADAFDIEVKRLDDFFSPGEKIKLIKIDIEGYELEALKGAKKILSSDSAPILVVECSENRENLNSTKEDLYKFITEVNHYRVFKLSGTKERISKLKEINNSSNLPDHDNIICIPKNYSDLIGKKFII